MSCREMLGSFFRFLKVAKSVDVVESTGASHQVGDDSVTRLVKLSGAVAVELITDWVWPYG